MVKNYKKLRYGGLSIALTALLIAIVVLLNVVISSLASKHLWFIDMTSNDIYTLSEKCVTELDNAVYGYTNESGEYVKGLNDIRKENGEDPVNVTIYFCDDPDNLMADSSQRYVYETALALAEKCEYINVDYLDWEYNPSTVRKYERSGNYINSYSVIVDADNYYTEGSSWTVMNLSRFYVPNEDSSAYVGYKGERAFASAILTVANVTSPIVYFTQNHSETFFDESLAELLADVGYKIEVADISDPEFEFSENGALCVVYNPQKDFTADELEKLDKFVNDNNSLMVFMGSNSPSRPTFEDYLETWGIVYQRHMDSDGKLHNYTIKDSTHSLSSDGLTIKGNYVTSGGLGEDVYSKVLNNGYAPSVVFDNAMSIMYSGMFMETMGNTDSDNDASNDYRYGSAYIDGEHTNIYDIFTANSSAVAISRGEVVSSGGSTGGAKAEETVIMYTDLDGVNYFLEKDGTKYVIVDNKGNELGQNQHGYYITHVGNLLRIDEEKGLIVSADGKGGTSTVICKSIRDVDKTIYILSDDGQSVCDSDGNVLDKNSSGYFVTRAGSQLKITDVNGEKSIEVANSTVGSSSEKNPYKLMTMSVRHHEQSDEYGFTANNSYVLACSSIEFASAEYLNNSVFGNEEVILAIAEMMNLEVVSVNIGYKLFRTYNISDLEVGEADAWTLWLVIIPPVIAFAAGTVVLLRRKHS